MLSRRQGRLDPPCLGRHRASLMYRAVSVGAGIRSRVIGAGGEADGFRPIVHPMSMARAGEFLWRAGSSLRGWGGDYGCRPPEEGDDGSGWRTAGRIRKERRSEEHCEQYPDPRTKGERPSQRVDEQPQIARVTDDPVDTARNQLVARLDGYQPTEPMTEHKDRPDPQRAPGDEQNDAKPADGIPVEGPKAFPVCVGRQKSSQQPD
jgi:hypothetical protein